MALKHLGKAKPNDPFFTRGYTINVVPNPPAPPDNWPGFFPKKPTPKKRRSS